MGFHLTNFLFHSYRNTYYGMMNIFVSFFPASNNFGKKVSGHSQTKNPGIMTFAFFVVIALALTTSASTAAYAQDCTPINIDLSASADAEWHSANAQELNGQCCGAPADENCMELIVTLHEDANSISIVFTSETGPGLYYRVNCGPQQSTGGSNIANICFDNENPGPHSIVFCNQGQPSYDFSVYATTSELNVTLQPFTPVCLNTPVFMLSGGAPSGGTYFINGDPMPLFNASSLGPGDHEIVYRVSSGGCTGFATQTITVSNPQISWTLENFCSGEGMVPLEIAQPEGGIYAGPDNLVHNNHFDTDMAVPGDYNITYSYTDEYGCSVNDTATITIHNTPHAETGTDLSVLTGTTANLSAENGGAGSYTYTWQPVDKLVNAAVQNPQTVPMTESTQFTLTVTDVFTGCAAQDQQVVNVTGGPLHIASIEADPSTVCQGSEVQLSALAGGGSGNYSWYWTASTAEPGFPSNIQSPVAFPMETTTYTVRVEDIDNPATPAVTMDVLVTVNDLPAVTLDIPATVCANTPGFALTGGWPEGGTYYFLDTDTLHINLPDLDLSDFLPNDVGPGDYLIMYEYTDASGCTNYDIKPFTILPYVKAQFYTSRDDICLSNEVKFANHSVGATHYRWEFSHGPVFEYNDENDFLLYFPDSVYTFPDIDYVEEYTITLIVTNEEGCEDVRVRKVKVFPGVEASFTATPLQGCSPLEVEFTSQSEGPILFHLWDFGDGTFSVEDDYTKTYLNNSGADSIFTVYLTVLSENYFCHAMDSIEITVHPGIEAGFTTTPSYGCDSLVVDFGNLAKDATTINWDFGNGVTYTGEDPPQQVYFNDTNDTIVYIITQEVINDQLCNDFAIDSLVVYPAVTAEFSASETEGCGPMEVAFEFLFPDNTSHNATEFIWDFGDGGSSSEQNPVHTFINETDASITYTVWLKVRSDYFCEDSVSMDITVHPWLEADFSFNPAQSCNEFDLRIVNASYGAADYYWYINDVLIHQWDTPQPEFTHFLEHNLNIPVDYSIKLLVTNPAGCSDSIEKTFTMFPKITSSFTPSVTEGCSPLTVDFDNGTIGGQNHLWEFGDGGSATLEHTSHIFENDSFTEEAVYDVWLYSSSDYLCKDSVNHQITVLPKVKADFSVDENQGCSPFIVTIENHSLGAQTLSWEFNDGTLPVESTDSILTYEFTNTTDAPVSYEIVLSATNAEGCTDEITRTITVFPEVQISNNNFLAGCHPFQTPLDYQIENGNYYQWDFGDGITSNEADPEHVFMNFSHTDPVTYDVSVYTSSVYGCFATATSQVEVYPKPDASFNITNSPGCSPHEIFIDHQSVGATGYLWDFGDGSGEFNFSSDTITHLYDHDPGSGPGIFPVHLITSNDFGCLDTLEQQVVIYPNISAEFETNVVEGCHPLTVDFTNQSFGATAETAYEWSYGNGHTSQNTQELHSHTFNNFSHTRDTVFTVLLTAYNENGCLDTTSIDIKVNPSPRAFFSIPNTPGCAPHEAIIHNFSIGVENYSWDMGDGTTFTHGQEHFTHEYTQPAGHEPGLFTLNLEVDNEYGCTHSHTQQIVIYPLVSAEFVADTEGCHPHTTSFQNSSEGANLYLWTFGNGTSSQSTHPQQTFTNYSHTESVTYTVNLLAESTYGCEATAVEEIIVRPVPAPLFELSPISGCSPFTPLLTNLSEGGDEFKWDMGTEEIETQDTTFYYTWHNTGEEAEQHIVSLTALTQYGCEATIEQTTTVYPEVTASFTTENETWSGCSPLPIKFINNSLLAETYQWDFQDENSSTSAAPFHVFENTDIEDRIFPVELVAYSMYGCTDTLVRDMLVYPSPVASFSADPREQAYPDATITLSNYTNPGYWTFDWEFGDGNHTQTTSPQPFTHTYVWDEYDMNTKDYVVSLFVHSEHCSDHLTRVITITSPLPKADFTSLNAGCEPFTVQFSNESMYAHTFRWEFGDGSYSDDPAPSHTFVDHGVYDVMMEAIGDGGRDTIYHQVEVYQNPTALFELVSNQINIPEEPLQVINQSELADFYMWDFGDGNVSYEFEPEYYYTEPGIYDITLIATRNTQPLCRDTLVLKNAPRVDESCKIIFPDAFMPSTTGPGTGHYEMDNPSTSVFHPVYEGIDDYVLEIYNRWGELIFRTTDLEVGWDGYYRGQLAKMDVYVWKVTGRCTNGRSIIQSGDVTLYR